MGSDDNRPIVGLSVMFGWFTVPLVAAVILVATASAEDPVDCEHMFVCVSDRLGMVMLMIFYGIPLTLLSMAAAGITYAVANKHIANPYALGTAAAWTGISAAALLACAYETLRP